MTNPSDQTPAQVRFARRFVAKTPDQPDIHGIQFPDSGHILADLPYPGLTSFRTINDLTTDYQEAVIHWAAEADEEQP